VASNTSNMREYIYAPYALTVTPLVNKPITFY